MASDVGGPSGEKRPRVSDYPDDLEAWPDLEEDLIPDMRELPMSGPFGPAFTYLHAARVTLDSGLFRPTILLTRTAARLALKAAEEPGTQAPSEEERQELEGIAAGDFPHEEPEDLLDALAALSAFVERRLTLPRRPGEPPG